MVVSRVVVVSSSVVDVLVSGSDVEVVVGAVVELTVEAVEPVTVVVVLAGSDVEEVASSVVTAVIVVDVVGRWAGAAVLVVVELVWLSASNLMMPPRVVPSRTLRFGVVTIVDAVGALGNPSALLTCIALIAKGAATAAAVIVDSDNASKKRLLPADVDGRC